MVDIHPSADVIPTTEHHRIPVQAVEAHLPGRVQQPVPDAHPIVCHGAAPSVPAVRAHLLLERVQPKDQAEEGVGRVRDATVLHETHLPEILVETAGAAVATAIEDLVKEDIEVIIL